MVSPYLTNEPSYFFISTILPGTSDDISTSLTGLISAERSKKASISRLKGTPDKTLIEVSPRSLTSFLQEVRTKKASIKTKSIFLLKRLYL